MVSPRFTPRLTYAVAAVGIVGVTLTGCGSSSVAGASTHNSASPGATTSTTSGTSGTAPTCPTAAAVSAAVGSTYPAPKVNSGAGEVICNYSGDSTNLVISFASGVTASTLQQVAQTEAQAQGVSITSVSGLGDAAFAYTLKDASTNSTGVATSNLLLVGGSRYIAMVGEMSAAQLEAVARVALSN